jgi:hypothetical protein
LLVDAGPCDVRLWEPVSVVIGGVDVVVSGLVIDQNPVFEGAEEGRGSRLEAEVVAKSGLLRPDE